MEADREVQRGMNRKTDIVLIGGGHAHVHVVAEFGRKPGLGIRVALIARERHTPYSGMLPGVVAGLYRPSEVHIDLARLCASADVTFVQAEATGLDRARKTIFLKDREPITYDVASIDIGIVPALDRIKGAAQHAVAVKPIGTFLAKFDGLLGRIQRDDPPRHIAVIGGGAGGVELILSMHARLRKELNAKRSAALPDFLLVTADELLASHDPKVRSAFRRILGQKNIKVFEHSPVSEVRPDALVLGDGSECPAEIVLMTTGAAPPAFLRNTDLTRDESGFLSVAPTLHCLNDDDVFAAGDCASIAGFPREKAGVFAVRAGPPLAENLRRRAEARSLIAWHPQHLHLALISTGERYAVASRGTRKCEGAWVWRLKDFLDRRWVRRYQR